MGLFTMKFNEDGSVDSETINQDGSVRTKNGWRSHTTPDGKTTTENLDKGKKG